MISGRWVNRATNEPHTERFYSTVHYSTKESSRIRNKVMKFVAAFLIFFLVLLQDVYGFLVAPSTMMRVVPVVSMEAKKKDSSEPPKREKPDPRTFKGLLKILVTGSPDGISMIGKPQYNWLTGEREYTAAKGPKKFGQK